MTKRLLLSLWAGLFVTASVAGCDDPPDVADPAPSRTEPQPTEEVEAHAETAEGETAEPGQPEQAAAIGPVATDDTSYTVRATSREGGYDQGSLASFGIHIEPQGEWHLNDLFPFSLEVAAEDAVSFPKSQLAQSDAASWEESEARFDVPFTASATGEHDVRATVRFAVCNPSTCVPKTVELALNVPVH